MILRDSIRCVVFDFDGTLIDSNRLKHDAWFMVFRPLGMADKDIMSLLAENLLADRYQLAELALQRVDCNGGTENCDQEVERLAGQYNAICEEGQATCPEIPGASGILAALAVAYALYVNSATPEEPLRRIVARRGWQDRFRGIYGRPREKTEVLAMIAAGENVGAQQIAMVGDGPADIEAAREFGCPFYAVGDLARGPVSYGVKVGSLSELPHLFQHPHS